MSDKVERSAYWDSAQDSTICIGGIHTHAWATGTNAWLVSWVHGHVQPFPFCLDYRVTLPIMYDLS